MILFKNPEEVKTHLSLQRQRGARIGFVPTMGALHPGHASLIAKSKEMTAVSVCSVFVNPTQFNDPGDFQHYPVTLDKDVYLLEKNGTDILFLPVLSGIYPDGIGDLEHYDLGHWETILDGKYRPGHFQGVCQVMERLLKIIEPDFLFMGEKDYQQCMVVKRLIAITGSGTKLVTCPIFREADGLAMSSRNMRLTAEERKKATAIYEALIYLKKNIKPGNTAPFVEQAKTMLVKNDFIVDYVEIADAGNLESINDWDGSQSIIALIAAFQHDVRLIDNMLIGNEHN